MTYVAGNAGRSNGPSSPAPGGNDCHVRRGGAGADQRRREEDIARRGQFQIDTARRFQQASIPSQALAVFGDLLDSLIVDVATEIHRATRLGLNCFPHQGWGVVEEGVDEEELPHQQVEGQGARGNLMSEASASPDLMGVPQGQQQQSGIVSLGKQLTAVVDVFGQTHPAVASESFECLNCGRQVVAGRYAPHLEKCMGKQGRISSRMTGRTVNCMQPRRSRTGAAAAVASSGSGGSGTGASRGTLCGPHSSSLTTAGVGMATGNTLGTPFSVGAGAAATMTNFHGVRSNQVSTTVPAARMATGRNPSQMLNLTPEGSLGSGGIDSADDADTSNSKQDRKKEAQSRGQQLKSRSVKAAVSFGDTQKVKMAVAGLSDAREKQAALVHLVPPSPAQSTVGANREDVAPWIEEKKASVNKSGERSRYLLTDQRVKGVGRWVGESDVSVRMGAALPSVKADLDDVPLGSSPMLKRRRKTKSTLLRTLSLAALDTGKKNTIARDNGAVCSASVANSVGFHVSLHNDTVEGQHAGPQGREGGRLADNGILADGRSGPGVEAPSSMGTSHNTALTEVRMPNGNDSTGQMMGVADLSSRGVVAVRVAGRGAVTVAASHLAGTDVIRLKERGGRDVLPPGRRKGVFSLLGTGGLQTSMGADGGLCGFGRSVAGYEGVSVMGMEGVEGGVGRWVSKEERGMQIVAGKTRSSEFAGEGDGANGVIKVKKRRQRAPARSRQSVKIGPGRLMNGGQLDGGWIVE